MQNRGAIRLLAVLFAIVSLYQLSFTFFAARTEAKAVEYSQRAELNDMAQMLSDKRGKNEMYYLDSLSKRAEKYYLDSMNNETVYNLGLFSYTYKECKEREINLGLDLKGGMNVTLEVAVEDIVKKLAGSNSEKPEFKKAIQKAHDLMRTTQSDFVSLFRQAWEEDNPNTPLATIFATVELKDQISPVSTNDEVADVLKRQADAAVSNTYDVLSKRIDKFGVAQPRIQKLQSRGRILVELPGVKDPSRVRKILQSTAQLEFWETHNFQDEKIYTAIDQANQITFDYYKIDDESGDKSENDYDELKLGEDETKVSEDIEIDESEEKDLLEEADSLGVDTSEVTSLLDAASETDTEDTSMVNQQNAERLFKYLMPNYRQRSDGQYYPAEGAVVGFANIRDTAKVNQMLSLPQVRSILPRDLKLLWGFKAPSYADNQNLLELYAIKVESRDGSAALSGEVITNARQDYDQNGRVEVSMSMNAEGSRIWKNLTGENVGSQIAIVLDNYVYSAPNVNQEIGGGHSQISGNFTVEEGKDLANVLKSGKLPVPARIIEEAIVGPSLGKEAVNSGLMSFIIAFILVLIYMVLYYQKAGLVADLALLANIFFLFGVLASLQAVLTLPGIAGIVLTLGMAVDANVIIFERIKEELRAGKGTKLAISDGYKNAYSAIIDGNVTTLLTGIVLYVFGSGPVQGFATTLIIGIITSLFSAIFVSRLTFSWLLNRGSVIKFGNKSTINFLANANFNIIGFRKKAYVISAVVILIGLGSLVFRGLNPGIDFAGGRTYVVRFDNNVNTQDIANSLKTKFVTEDGVELSPVVKTFGPESQVKISTKYLIDDRSIESDSIVDYKVYHGTKDFFETEISSEEFFSSDEDKVLGQMSSQKVDPTISNDLIWESYLAVFFALIIIFSYIALRFRKWQFGVGGLVALIHDSLIVVSLYSIFYNVLPFDLEVDQAFIAAILTIIGYSINDSVIIFDRIREYFNIHKKTSILDNMNGALNSTLARTINTSGTTFVVLLAIFIFGGEVIRGFTFALMVGVVVGTYSSLFVASSASYELLKRQEDKRALKTKPTKSKK
jgi:SecD/SecF fusion protein